MYNACMIEISQPDFEKLVTDAIDNIPEPYGSRLQNVAFLVEDEPTPQQRQQLGLRCDQSLFGLYEGVPLPARNGTIKLLPDKITIFKRPMEYSAQSLEGLKEQVGRTVWHEVAHYYGLNHERIHALERKPKPGPAKA
jgi:predicted Zn-dependent protease with MMP-like domain